MSEDMMNLRSLVEKRADADVLREMIGFKKIDYFQIFKILIDWLANASTGQNHPFAHDHSLRRTH